MTVPSSALAGAAVSAAALARIVGGLAATLPLPEATATAAMGLTRRVVRIAAPRLQRQEEAALIVAELVRTVQAVARAADPHDAAPRLLEAAGLAAMSYPVSASPALTRAYALARAMAAGVETACLGEAFLAEARTSFSDRRAATEARERIGAAMDGAADRIAATLGQAAVSVLSAAARETSAFLLGRAADLQPIVRVEATRSYPAAALAWSLYGDPERAAELADRNRVGTPLFMPAAIEAVSPKA